MEFNYIETKRLKLRVVNEKVIDFVFTNFTESELIEFFDVKHKDDLKIERYRYQNNLTTFNKKLLYFHLIEKKSQKIIGWCGYHTWYTDHNRAELGYGLYAEKWKRKGLMSEAVEVILPFGFEEMKLHRIEALIGRTNIASFKVLDKFGFQKEGELREHYLIDGNYEDSIIYSLLKKINE